MISSNIHCCETNQTVLVVIAPIAAKIISQDSQVTMTNERTI